MLIPRVFVREIRLLFAAVMLFGVSYCMAAQEAPKKSVDVASIGVPVGQRSIFRCRSIWTRTNQRNTERFLGNDTAVFSFGRLVTVLQSAAGAAAKRETTF
jgi:hypothetical protein